MIGTGNRAKLPGGMVSAVLRRDHGEQAERLCSSACSRLGGENMPPGLARAASFAGEFALTAPAADGGVEYTATRRSSRTSIRP